MTDLTLQAATDSALVALLLAQNLLVLADGGTQPAPGVTYSHIGRAVLNGVPLDGRYAFVGLDESIIGGAETALLLTALAPHTYTGPALRLRLGGAGYAPSREQAIKDERDRRINNGGYKVGNDWFHSDLMSRTQQIGLVMIGANLPAGLQWKTLGGGYVAMTPTLAQQVFAAAVAADQAHHATAAAAIDNGTALAAIVWPEIFKG